MTTQLQSVVGSLVNANELPVFADHFLKNSQGPATFWKAVAADPMFAGRAAALKLAAQVKALTNNQPGLAEKILAVPNVKEAKDLVNGTADQWTALIQSGGVGVPPSAPGATDAGSYVGQTLTQVEAAFPTPFLAARLPASPVATDQQASVAQATIPNWQTLFGGFDFCACEECAAAHGPAAYFVDILQFLGDRSARDALFARRPDLGRIMLSCENTNTALPYVDIVNEILEDTVAPAAAFTPFTLSASLEADLAEPVATTALSGAFIPPLHSGTRTLTLTAGARWRLVDQSFSYSVVKEGGALNVVTRSRQTIGTADELRATPQYRNEAAYGALEQAVFPWSLPFELPSADANAFLTYLGVSRRDLIEARGPAQEPFDAGAPVTIRLAAEGLGLTATERKILVGEALTPPRSLADFWGGVALPSPAPVSDGARALGSRLRRSDGHLVREPAGPLAAFPPP